MTQPSDVTSAIAYREHDVVSTRAAIWDDGHIYPSGSSGTIVYIHKGGDSFEVEFTAPAPTVVTLERRDLGEVQWRA